MKRPHKFKQPFRLKRWTENRALMATNARFRKIDELLIEIALLWGDESVQARAEEREAA